MEKKIVKIGNLEQKIKIFFRWDCTALKWHNLSFDELHAKLSQNKTAVSLARTIELQLPENTTKLKLLPATGIGITKVCIVDLENSDENCDAVVEYLFREYTWSPRVDWKVVRGKARVAEEVDMQELTAEYKISDDNKV